VEVLYFKPSGKYYTTDLGVVWPRDASHYSGWAPFEKVARRIVGMVALCIESPLGFPQMHVPADVLTAWAEQRATAPDPTEAADRAEVQRLRVGAENERLRNALENEKARHREAKPCEHSGLDRAEYDLSYESGDGKLDWCAECGAVRVRKLKPRTAAMGDHYPQFKEGTWCSPVRATENTGRKMRERMRERGMAEARLATPDAEHAARQEHGDGAPDPRSASASRDGASQYEADLRRARATFTELSMIGGGVGADGRRAHALARVFGAIRVDEQWFTQPDDDARTLVGRLAQALYTHVRTDLAPDAALSEIAALVRDITGAEPKR
jgi:hypothetical protein